MNLTSEQIAIIHSSGDIKINAVAGSGKTTTIIEYAKTRPAGSKILYLAFNKSVKLEAIKKFSDNGLPHVKVETAHSLAFKNIVFQNNYTVKGQGYKTNEIADILSLKSTGEKHTEYILANHINKFIAYFCNSDKQKVNDLNYLDTITDEKARAFVKSHYSIIEKQSRIFLSKMNNGEIDIIHDFYLKKFQISNPQLNFDYILFDEGQDASPTMLDIFLKQRAVKVIVGDTHQQIYGWRHAVNSLEKATFKTFNLSVSFRFSQPVANLAMEILQWKSHLMEFNPIKISGNGKSKSFKSKATLARTNLGLLLKAIEYVSEKKEVKKIYFEGNFNSYTYADEGASLYDVLNLYNDNRHQIKDTLIKAMRDIEELEEYISKTEDVQLGMMLEIVKEYGNEIYQILKQIKAMQVDNDEKEKAEMIFSTVHRCKGMEYDTVQLVNDFISEEKIEKLQKQNEELNEARINEEINLLYVAVTRTRNSIHIPETLLPKGFEPASQIHALKVIKETEEDSGWNKRNSGKHYQPKQNEVSDKKLSFEKTKNAGTESYKPWTNELDSELTVMYCEGVNVKDIAKHFGRTKGAIMLRIKKLELAELYGF